MNGRFSDELWDGITDIYAAILAHPFLAGMTDGSLPADAFTFYVVQDALYLRRYAQALAAGAPHAPDPAQTEMFARHPPGIVAGGRGLHPTRPARPGIQPAPVGAPQGTPPPPALNTYPPAAT